jgi:hypothetical protein
LEKKNQENEPASEDEISYIQSIQIFQSKFLILNILVFTIPSINKKKFKYIKIKPKQEE